MGPSCEFSLNEDHLARQKLDSLRAKYRQLWDKVNKYKRKVKKQSQEKRELREIIAELEQGHHRHMQQQQFAPVLKQQLLDKIGDLEKQNSELGRQLRYEKEFQEQSKQALVDELRQGYEIKLIEAKKNAKRMVHDSQILQEEI